MGGREVFCAVTEDACDAEQYWIPPWEVHSKAGLDCFLCREESPPPNDSGTDYNAEAPAIAPMQYGDEQTPIQLGTSDSGNIKPSNTKTIATVVGVGCFFAMAIIGVIGARFVARRRAARAAEEAKKAELPPMDNIQIPSETDCEAANPSIDTDNASVLSDGSHDNDNKK